MAISDDAEAIRPGPGEGRGGPADGGGSMGDGPRALDPQDPAADPADPGEEHSRLSKVFRKLCFLSRSLDEAEAWAAGRSSSPGDSGQKAPPSGHCLERARKVVTLENIEEHLEREAPG